MIHRAAYGLRADRRALLECIPPGTRAAGSWAAQRRAVAAVEERRQAICGPVTRIERVHEKRRDQSARRVSAHDEERET